MRPSSRSRRDRVIESKASRLGIRIARLLDQLDLRLSPFRRGRLAVRTALGEQRGPSDRIARFQRRPLLGAFHGPLTHSPALMVEGDNLFRNIARRALSRQENGLQVIEKSASER